MNPKNFKLRIGQIRLWWIKYQIASMQMDLEHYRKKANFLVWKINRLRKEITP